MKTPKQFPLFKEFIYFVNERWAIHQRRLAGKPAPWTKDEILRTYRFCNVRREDDRVTIWVSEHLRSHVTDPDLWFAAYIARVFNRPSTLAAIGYPSPWKQSRTRVQRALDKLRQQDSRIFNAAYIVSTNGSPLMKVDFYIAMFDALWTLRTDLRPRDGELLKDFHKRLMRVRGIGSFMAGQVIADMKYFAPLDKAGDWRTFAASGPGSRRGLNWVCGNPVHQHWTENFWHDTLMQLRAVSLTELPRELAGLDAQNLQNCLCEFSKYCKVKHEGKRAKQLFKPSEEEYVCGETR